MKKVLCLVLCFVFALSLCACSNGDGQTTTTASQASVSNNTSTGEPDIDLTKLSSTMVYSEVYNMMSKPKKYLGQKVKMNGTFTVYYSQDTDRYYFACLIADATACCSQGLEFVLKEELTYPDDYPPIQSEITVEGLFDTYMENGTEFYQLIDARFV